MTLDICLEVTSQIARSVVGDAVRSRIERRCPPYRGDEPYLHLCFSAKDAAAIQPLIERLYDRGVRLWYAGRPPSDAAARARYQARVAGATLTLVWISDAARQDRDIKGVVLMCEQERRPLVCIDADQGDHELSLGLTSAVPHLVAWNGASADDLEEQLIHAQGFVQELLGPKPTPVRTRMRRTAVALSLAALVACAVGAGMAWHMGLIAPSSHHPGDTPQLTSPQLIAAARLAKGGGAVADEDLRAIRTLRLTELPDEPSELALFASLRRVEIPPSLAADAEPIIGDAYDVVIVGEG